MHAIEILTLIISIGRSHQGRDQMRSFVSAMFFFFLHSLAKFDGLVTEIRTTLDSEDDISIDGKLNQCEYL